MDCGWQGGRGVLRGWVGLGGRGVGRGWWGRLEEGVDVCERELGGGDAEFFDVGSEGAEVRDVVGDDLGAVKIQGAQGGGESGENEVDVCFVQKAVADDVAGEIEVDEAGDGRVGGEEGSNAFAGDVGAAAEVEVGETGGGR